MICSLCGIADLFTSSHQISDYPCHDGLWVVGLAMEVPVSVSWLTVDLSHDFAIVLYSQYIEKKNLSVFYLHGKLDGWSYAVDVL